MTDLESTLRASLLRHAEDAPSGHDALHHIWGGSADTEPGTRRWSTGQGLSIRGAALATAAIVVAGAVLAGGPDDAVGQKPVVSGSARVAAAPPRAPAGARLVGLRDIVVAVPAEWSTNDIRCGEPMSDTVSFDSDKVRSCRAMPSAGISALHIVDSESQRAASFIEQAQPAGEVDGVSIARTPVAADGTGGYIGALVVNRSKVVMWVTSLEQSTIERVLDSVAVLPDGYVTVPIDPNGPWRSTRGRMLQAGLDLSIVRRARAGLSGNVILDIEPPAGAVVPKGSTVRVTLTAGADGRSTKESAARR